MQPASATKALLLLALIGAQALLVEAKKKHQHEKCAICEFVVLHLADRTGQNTAEGKTFEMGWRLLPDGTREQKDVPWAHSELGFGAEIEQTCKNIEVFGNYLGPLAALVQFDADGEIVLREADKEGPNGAFEGSQTIGSRKQLMDLYQTLCNEFIFSHEGSLDPVREWDNAKHGKSDAKQRWPPHLSLPDFGIKLVNQICTDDLGVCPAKRWAALYGGPGGTPTTKIQIKTLPAKLDKEGNEIPDTAGGTPPQQTPSQGGATISWWSRGPYEIMLAPNSPLREISPGFVLAIVVGILFCFLRCGKSDDSNRPRVVRGKNGGWRTVNPKAAREKLLAEMDKMEKDKSN